jgi:hypothetical protein
MLLLLHSVYYLALSEPKAPTVLAKKYFDVYYNRRVARNRGF